jgi:hypothetical protein
MAGTGAIFRIDANGETEATANAANQVIEFNGGLKPDNTGRGTANSFHSTRDINFHPNPRRALDQLQDGLLGVLEVTIEGYFVDHDTTTGPAKFLNWQKEPAMSSALKWGRFGIRLDDFAGGALNLTPSTTTGYVLWDVEVIDAESPRDQVSFTAKFYRNGTI